MLIRVRETGLVGMVGVGVGNSGGFVGVRNVLLLLLKGPY